MNQDLSNHGITEQPFVPLQQETWVRNPEWLAMPSVSPTEHKIVALVRVDPANSNLLAFAITTSNSTGYYVDWGDGTNTTYANNATANHNFDYAAVSGSPTSEGYKQVLVTITAVNAGVGFSNINFYTKHPAASSSVPISSGILDIIISSSFASSISLCSGSTTMYHNFCERVQIISCSKSSLAYQCYQMSALRVFYMRSSAALTSLNYAFYYCKNLISVDLQSSSTYPSLTNTSNAFIGCTALTYIPPMNLPALTDGSSMFSSCISLRIAPDITFPTSTGITTLNVSTMFNACSNLVKIPEYNLSRVTNAASMFSNCYALINVPALNLVRATAINSMFASCYSLASVAGITTSTALIDCNSMFSSCGVLQTAPYFETSSVTTFASMFSACYELISCPSYNTSSSTNFSSMFSAASRLVEIPAFDYSKCTNTSSMFSACYRLKKINGPITFSSAATAISATGMFQSCYALVILPTITFNTNNTSVNASSMYSSCFSLMTIPDVNLSKVTSTTNIAGYVTSCGNISTLLLTGLQYGGLTLNAKLSAPALIALFNSLGTASGAQTLTVSGNWGWANLTAADKLIATNKGWTLA